MAKRYSKLAAEVVGVAADAVGSAHGLPGLGKPVETLMRDLLQVQDELAESLSRIEGNVKLLVDAPWSTARIHLEECMIPGRTPAQITASLSKAADLLREALALQSPGTISATYVALDLAIVLTILNDREAGKYYARIAIEAGTQYLLGFAGVAGSYQLNKRARANVREQADDAAKEWYWLARAVDPILGAWPMDQLDKIEQESMPLVMDVRRVAIDAFNKGEGGPHWVPPLAEEARLYDLYKDAGLWD
jgi:hypothetical protein